MSESISPTPLWDPEWAYKKAAQAIYYLAEKYPEGATSEALDPYYEAVNKAALQGNRGAYEQALRAYMRAGGREALRVRKEAA
jgi:hypothetical protein